MFAFGETFKLAQRSRMGRVSLNLEKLEDRLLLSGVSDHIEVVEILRGLDYGSPGDTLAYCFEVMVSDDFSVQAIEFETPTAAVHSITDHEVEETFSEWEFWFESTNEADLSDFTHGDYEFTFYYSGGKTDTTTVFFGNPNTLGAIADVTQKPVITSPTHSSSVASPVTFSWQACTDPNAEIINLMVEDDEDAVDEMLATSVTSFGPALIDEDDWDVELAFGKIFEGDNADGVPFLVGKYSESGVAFTVTSSHVVGSFEYGEAQVTIFDMSGPADINAGNILVKWGNDESVSSITIGGAQSMEGLGIAISGAPSVGSIKDARTGSLGDVAFICTDASIKSIQLKSGMSGYDLNGLCVGGLSFDADIDGDGDTSDAVAIATSSTIGSIKLETATSGDVLIGGMDAKGASLKSFGIKSGGYQGDLRVEGDIGKLSFGGNFGSNIESGGSLGGLTVKGGDISAQIDVGGSIKSITASGDKLGHGGSLGVDILCGGEIGKIDAKGGDVWATINVQGGIRSVSASANKLGSGGSVHLSALSDGEIGKVDAKGGDVVALASVDADIGSIKASASKLGTGGSVSGLIASSGSIGKIQAMGGDFDAQVGAADVGTVDVKEGDVTSDAQILVSNALKSVKVSGGDFAGLIKVVGELGSLSVKGSKTGGGDLAAGSHIYVGGLLKKVSVGGSIAGGSLEEELVQLFGQAIGAMQVGGNVTNARVIAGAYLGEDWAIGGTGHCADSFTVGTLGKISVKGSVSDSLIGAGLITHDDAFDLDWLSTNNEFLDGSLLGSLSIGGTLTSSAPTGMPYGVGAYAIGKVKVGDSAIHALVVSEV